MVYIKYHILFHHLYLLQAAGKKTGFVTTTRMTHATPAALYAKTVNRLYYGILTIPHPAETLSQVLGG